MEADYNGDDWAFWGAACRGTGLTMMSFSTSLAAPTAAALGGMGMAISTGAVAVAITGVGLCLLAAGMICLLFTKEDMELWIENGFWGDSDEYWGKPLDGYEWTDKREAPNKFIDQWKKSFFTYKQQADNTLALEETTEYDYYEIEMQRFFAFTDKATLTKIDNTTLKVQYQGITDNDIAQQIRLVRLRFKLTGGPIVVYEVTPTVLSIEFEQAGQAILKLPARWKGHYNAYTRTKSGNYGIEDGSREFNAYRINNIDAKVTIPRYQSASETIEAELHFTANSSR